MTDTNTINNINDVYDNFRDNNYHSNNNNNNNNNNNSNINANGTLPLIEFREGNLLDLDWSDGDLIFISSLCFPGYYYYYYYYYYYLLLCLIR